MVSHKRFVSRLTNCAKVLCFPHVGPSNLQKPWVFREPELQICKSSRDLMHSACGAQNRGKSQAFPNSANQLCESLMFFICWTFKLAKALGVSRTGAANLQEF